MSVDRLTQTPSHDSIKEGMSQYLVLIKESKICLEIHGNPERFIQFVYLRLGLFTVSCCHRQQRWRWITTLKIWANFFKFSHSDLTFWLTLNLTVLAKNLPQRDLSVKRHPCSSSSHFPRRLLRTSKGNTELYLRISDQKRKKYLNIARLIINTYWMRFL